MDNILNICANCNRSVLDIKSDCKCGSTIFNTFKLKNKKVPNLFSANPINQDKNEK